MRGGSWASRAVCEEGGMGGAETKSGKQSSYSTNNVLIYLNPPIVVRK